MTEARPITLCVVIPTLDAAVELSALLNQIGDPNADANTSVFDLNICVSDGLSSDETVHVALRQEIRVAVGSVSRGAQLARGVRWADMTGSPSDVWYLMLHTDSQLPENWREAVTKHIQTRPKCAGYFRYGADTRAFWGRIMEFWVGMRCFWWGLPYGDQGFLISKAQYDAIGGYQAMPLFEDVDMIDRFKARFGRWALRPLKGKIITDVSSYARNGWWLRSRRNMRLLKAYRNGASVETLQQHYQ